MQHIIFGAGLIGGYFAGVMASKKLDVGLVARTSVQEKLSKGLRLTDYLKSDRYASQLIHDITLQNN